MFKYIKMNRAQYNDLITQISSIKHVVVLPHSSGISSVSCHDVTFTSLKNRDNEYGHAKICIDFVASPGDHHVDISLVGMRVRTFEALCEMLHDETLIALMFHQDIFNKL